ncbi:Fibroblast growth factor receptor 4 [Amphibalanus amphitrite]|uniref:Fibroblast growth factor receptor 4 n=1 Tax=Amphibalanus amphitrite TaxID=1232801 RepID=A0A6A4VVK3_AMPAM|nr:Fibroblast growth factor receptor 4 [Amphibalanus amphitrite]
MRQCWQEQPSSRPTFSELSQWFDRMLQSGSEYLDLSTPLVLNREYFDLLSDGANQRNNQSPTNQQPTSATTNHRSVQPPTTESPLRSASNNQSPLRYGSVDQSARKPERLTYSSLLAHGSDTEDGGARDLPLNYSSLLLPDSEPEEGEDSGSGSDNPPRETCDEQCGLMEVSV